jgi:hypothetical protein
MLLHIAGRERAVEVIGENGQRPGQAHNCPFIDAG